MEDKYQQSMDILNRYYRELVDKLTQEISDREDELEVAFYGPCQEILDNFAQRFNNLYLVNQHLQKFVTPPPGAQNQTMRLKEIRSRVDDMERDVNRWLSENPNYVPYSIAPFQGEDTLRCYILYKDNSKGA